MDDPFEVEVEELLQLAPLDRAQRSSALMDRHRIQMSRLATIRGHALIELRDQGLSAIEIGDELGITRQQAHRLMRDAEGVGGYSFHVVSTKTRPKLVDDLDDALQLARQVGPDDEWEVVQLPFDGNGAGTPVRRGRGRYVPACDLDYAAQSWTEWYVASQKRADGRCMLCDEQRGMNPSAATKHARQHLAYGEADEIMAKARAYFERVGTGHLEGEDPKDPLAPLAG